MVVGDFFVTLFVELDSDLNSIGFDEGRVEVANDPAFGEIFDPGNGGEGRGVGHK
jgi:hypothetical protein